MEKGKKKNMGLIVLLVLLILIVLGLVGYILIDKDIIKLKSSVKCEVNDKCEVIKKVDNKKDDTKYIKTTDKKVVSTLDTIMSGLSHYSGIWDYFTDKKVTVDSLDEEIIQSVALKVIVDEFYKNNEHTHTPIQGYSFSADKYESIIKSIFDISKVENKSIKNCPNFDYNADTKTYTAGEPACGGTSGPWGSVEKITKVTQKGNNLEMYVRVLFYDSASSSYYYDYNHTKKVSEIVLDDNTTLADIESFISSGSLYKLTFKVKDDNYLFVSSEPVNS